MQWRSCSSLALGLTIAISTACGSQSSHGLGTDEGDQNGGSSGGPSGDDSSSGAGSGDNGQFAMGSGSSSGSSGDGGGVPITTTSVDRCATGAPSGLSAASVKALQAGGNAGS